MSVKPQAHLMQDTSSEDESDDVSCWKRRSRLEKCLLVFLWILLALVLSLAIALGVLRHSLGNRIKELEDGVTCPSAACVTSASFILNAMNASVDPCEDFHAYACGNWEKNNPLPYDKLIYGPIYTLMDRLSHTIKELVSAPIQNDEVEAIKKVKMMYKSCLNLVADLKVVHEQTDRAVIQDISAIHHGVLQMVCVVSSLLLDLDKSEAFDIGIPSDIVLFDFHKSFESVVHTKLLYKLQTFGFEGAIVAWIDAFVTLLLGSSNRTRRFTINVQVWDTTTKDLFATLDEYGGWPIINPDADASKFDWLSVEASFVLLPAQASVVEFAVEFDLKNTSRKIIYLTHPGLYQERTYLLDPVRYAEDIAAYMELMVDVVTILANGTVTLANITQDVDDMVQLETEIAKISMSPEKERDMHAIYYNTTIKEFQATTNAAEGNQKGNEINWLRFIQSALKDVYPIDENEPIVVLDVEYFKKLGPLLGKTNKRILANYMLWSYLLFAIKSLSPEATAAYMKYKRATSGTATFPERWKTCLQDVRAYFDMAVGSIFVQNSFPASSKAEAEEMIDDIKSVFMEMLGKNEWMDEVTKRAAMEKAHSLTTAAGYPDWILNATELNTYYKEVHITENDYASTKKSFYAVEVKRSLLLLREQPLDKTIWQMSPATVNAYYNSLLNTIKIPAGFLQVPFFVGGSMKALNFGSIGSIIGHEITHGFDDKGRQFDKDGNVAKWWSDEAIIKFKGLAKCYVDQYASFCPLVGGRLGNGTKPICVDGNLTLGENIADNGGLKAAYKGYKMWISQNKEEPKLPGLHYTSDQLFFLAFAQTYCTNVRPQVLHYQILKDVHSPNKYRILGTLSNSKEFAKAYNCPESATMNRGKDRCEMW